jgi:hypothetical protein
MNFFKKIKNLKYYSNILEENRAELYEKFNIKIDNIYRMYTVYNIDESEWKTYGGDKPILYENKTLEDFLTNKSSSGAMMNGEEYFDRIIKIKLSKLDQYLISKGLGEMYGLSSKYRIDKLNVKVVIEYKYISTLFLANMALILGITILSSLIIGAFLIVIF